MWELIAMIATAIVAFILGRLTAWPTIRSLHQQLTDAIWWLGHDHLTGLFNRPGLLTAHLTTPTCLQPCILLLIDLDAFKSINDVHGHVAGDALLIAVADLIEEVATLHGGIAARLSGDEFAALLPVRDHEIGRLADTFATMTAAPVTLTIDGEPLTVTVTASVGACWAESGDLLDGDILRRADIAMYHAKHHGGNRYALYEPGMAMPPGDPRPGTRLRDLRQHRWDAPGMNLHTQASRST